jgi:hypothetical protein
MTVMGSANYTIGSGCTQALLSSPIICTVTQSLTTFPTIYYTLNLL